MPERSERAPDYVVCFNCGGITPLARWGIFVYDPAADERIEWTGTVIEADERGLDTADPMMRCPACRHEHVDDDGNPGLYEGTRQECEEEREIHLVDSSAGWLDDWAERALATREVTDEMVDRAAEAAFFEDDLGGHIRGRWTWDTIPDEGRENYRTTVRAALRHAGEGSNA